MRLRRTPTAGDTSGLIQNSVQFACLDPITYLKLYTNKFSFTLAWSLWAAIAQSIQRLATGWTVRGSKAGWGSIFSAPVQTGSGAHPASCTTGTVSFPGVKSGRGVTLTLHPLLVPWSRQYRAIPLLPCGLYGLYRAPLPVQGCTLPFYLACSSGFILTRLKVRASECLLQTGKERFIHMNITKARRGNGGISPLILNPGTMWDDGQSSPRHDRFTSDEMSPSFPLYKRLSGPQNRH